MQLESEDLVHQFRTDWPLEAEASTLRLLSQKLSDENTDLRAEVARLTAAQPSTFSATVPRTYGLDDQEGRHA